ncbi:DUF4157 domain-containing protein [Crocosphaera sp.]|uniref:eCIS core domain-containing protein n=1 Tax=Crocosphaera sp. TaxID=2729996 RepID=UPI002580C797|nr:DUF4157 domain-containing protein [Crocosphaera sp.]NQZ64452.1 DUF4157 domain-containing protein [Crocosphaera sp.]
MKTPSELRHEPTAQKLTSNGGSASKELSASPLMQRRQQQQICSGTAKQRRINYTGLRLDLKTGMEHLSGYNLDHVRVHYNSTKPGTVDAEAYAQGYDIHLARGQEKQLPHELGHVVQQMRGQVEANGSIRGMALNDATKLEEEASWLGNTALLRNAAYQRESETKSPTSVDSTQPLMNGPIIHRGAPIQRVLRLKSKADINDDDFLNSDTETVGRIIEQIQDKWNIYEYANWYMALTHDASATKKVPIDERNLSLDTDTCYTSRALTRLISTRYLIVGDSVKGMTRMYVGDKTTNRYTRNKRRQWARGDLLSRNTLCSNSTRFPTSDPWLLEIHNKCNANEMDLGHAQLMVRLSSKRTSGVLRPGKYTGKCHRAFNWLHRNYKYNATYGQREHYAWVVNSTWQPTEGRAAAKKGAKNAKTRGELAELSTDLATAIVVGTMQMIVATTTYIDNNHDSLTDAPFTAIAQLLPTIMDMVLMLREGRINSRIFGTSFRLIAEALSMIHAQFGTDDGTGTVQTQVGEHNVPLRELSIVLHAIGYVGDMVIYNLAVLKAERLSEKNKKLGKEYVEDQLRQGIMAMTRSNNLVYSLNHINVNPQLLRAMARAAINQRAGALSVQQQNSESDPGSEEEKKSDTNSV